jgi:GNAT superfamily N-acetyltransferase
MRPGDSESWSVLLAAMREADRGWEIYTVRDLKEEFEDPDWDIERGSVALVHENAMIGFGVVSVRPAADPIHDMRYDGGVHPDFRGRGIGGQLISWAEEQAVILHLDRFPGQPLSLSTSCSVTHTGAMTLHEQRGYHRRRWFNNMTRELAAPMPKISEPPGIEILGWEPERSADARFIRNEAFRDHWGSTEWTVQGWEHLMGSAAFRPEFSFVAYSEVEPVGVVVCQEYEVDPAAKGRDLYVWIVGTRRSQRKRGVASALLARVLKEAAGAGFATASLEADADSPTGAIGLYQGLGFVVEHVSVVLTKDLDMVSVGQGGASSFGSTPG